MALTYETKDTGEALALALCGLLDLMNAEKRITYQQEAEGHAGVFWWTCNDTEERRKVSDAYFAQIHRGTEQDLPSDDRVIAVVVAECLRKRKNFFRDFAHVRAIYV
jgi:hypothetical protein